MLTAIVVNLLALYCLLIALRRDKVRAREAMAVAWRSFLQILPKTIVIVMLIGLILGFVPKAVISQLIGEQAGLKGVLIAASLGTVLHLPSILAFPLAASLLQGGASITAVAVFITTLTMIGLVTLPLEVEALGAKLTLLRNSLSFAIAIIIGILMGVLL